MPQGFASAGVTTREIDLTGPTSIEPVGIPAGIVGTSVKGPAFVPLTLPTMNDFVVKFGAPTNIYKNGPLAANEWLRNAQSVTFMRVLGVGDGAQRTSSGNNKGKVQYAGFVVGDRQPQTSVTGNLTNNPYAVTTGAPGKTYFLATIMSQSANSTFLTDAGLSASGQMVLRGVLMAASGVVLTLSSSTVSSSAPSTLSASSTTTGATTGSVYLGGGLQEFVMFLNGWNGADSTYSNVITASFDVSAPNYFGKIFNKDPLKMENAGYLLYSQYDIHPALAVVTGSGILTTSASAVSAGPREKVAFLFTNNQTWNSGTLYAPNYEGFEDRFQTAATPWFISQKFGGRPVNLFQVVALSDGEEPNSKLKISIENIQPSTPDVTDFGVFDLLVRDINDNDNNKVVLEQWRGLSLDVSNPRFIGNMIGDTRVFFNFDATTGKQKLTTTGNYPVRSRYIRVVIADDVLNGEMPDSALPMGFRGPAHLVTSGSAPMPAITDATTWTTSSISQRMVQPPVPFRLALTRGTSPTQSTDRALYWGVQFERQDSATDPNSSYVPNDTIKSLTKYFPTYHTDWKNPIAVANEGTADTAENGILDADRFNNNLFSLENVKVSYNSVTNIADVTNLEAWTYVRNGSISTDTSAYTRALTVDDLTDPGVRAVAKFSVYLQGGFDGTRIFNADTARLTNKAIVEEMNYSARGYSSGPTVTAYTKALSLMNDTTEVDIQLLALPGIRHRYVTDTALRVTENRFDALYLFDIEERDTTNTLVTSDSQVISVAFTATDFASRGVNSSFGAAYFPDVTLRDQFNRSVVRVPPTVAVLGAFSKNDAVAYPWFAPAGFTRGALDTTNEPVVRLSQANMDSLYTVNINPIVSFAGSTGPVVWGQKTVLARQSSLDRVNVRRLLISLRREVRRVANKILFEQNKEATLARFSQLVNPIFKKVQDQQGIDNFKVVIDTSITTEADIENKTIRGKIFIVPTKTLEFLSIDFVLTNRGNFIQG
jgi:phage tail sheath protein FI